MEGAGTASQSPGPPGDLSGSTSPRAIRKEWTSLCLQNTRVVWEGKIIAKLIDECECKICDLKRVNIMLYYTEKLLFHNSVLFLECIGGLILENLCLIHYTNR